MIDYSLSNLFKEDSIDKQLIVTTEDNITIDNSMISSEEFSLEERLCSDESLTFGSCEASSITLKVNNIVSPLIGKWLNVSIVLDGNTDEPFTIGKYKVDSDKPTADRSWRDIIAYDAMYDLINADVTSWYNGLTFPITLANFRKSLLTYLGVEYVTQDLVNDSLSIEKTIDASGLSGKAVLNAIGEINGVFGHINRSGKFEWKSIETKQEALLPSNTLYPAEDLYPQGSNAENMSGLYKDCVYEDYETETIKKVKLIQTSDEDDQGTSVGTNGNTYTIRDNFLIKGKTEEQTQAIGLNFLNAVKGITYRPTTVNAAGNPCIEVGDTILLHTSKQVIYSNVLTRKLSGIQALNDSLESTGSQVYSDDVNSISNSITDLKGRYSKLVQNIDEVSATVGDLEKQTEASLKVNADAITAEVSRASGAESALSASLALKVGVNDYGQVVSMINASADQINLKSNRLVVDSTNFKLNSSGQVTVVDELQFEGDGETHTVLYHNARSGEPCLDVNDATFSGDVVVSGTLTASVDYSNSTGKLSGSGGYILVGANSVYPSSDNTLTLGYSERRFKQLYAGTATINTSDRNEKKSIESLDDKYISLFEKLMPVSFQYIDGTSGRTHIGFISQDVEDAMNEVGLTDLDFAGFCKDEVADENGTKKIIYGLRYSEFIALNTRMIQKTREEIEALKNTLIKKGVIDE